MDFGRVVYAGNYAALSGGLGGWFGAIYGANLALVDPVRPRNPFQLVIYVSQKGVRYGAVGAAAFGAFTFAFKSYEYKTQDLK